MKKIERVSSDEHPPSSKDRESLQSTGTVRLPGRTNNGLPTGKRTVGKILHIPGYKPYTRLFYSPHIYQDDEGNSEGGKR